MQITTTTISPEEYQERESIEQTLLLQMLHEK
jgi:hypothetical protein